LVLPPAPNDGSIAPDGDSRATTIAVPFAASCSQPATTTFPSGCSTTPRAPLAPVVGPIARPVAPANDVSGCPDAESRLTASCAWYAPDITIAPSGCSFASPGSKAPRLACPPVPNDGSTAPLARRRSVTVFAESSLPSGWTRRAPSSALLVMPGMVTVPLVPNVASAPPSPPKSAPADFPNAPPHSFHGSVSGYSSSRA
jgi:hypothetical protein